MRKVIRGVIAALLFGAFAPSAGAAPGSPSYESSDPARGERVHKVEEVSITFNEILDPNSSDMNVTACGDDVTRGDSEVVGDTISVEVGASPPGTYVVTYSVSGLDDRPEGADPSRGSYRFSLHLDKCENDGGHHNDKPNKGRGGHDGHGKGDREPGGRDDHGEHGDGGGGSTRHAEHTTSGGDHGAGHGPHRGRGDGGHHSNGDRRKGHDGTKKGSKHHGDKGHSGHDQKGGGRGDRAERRADRPNDALSLALVLLLPAVVGGLGGRALRARAVASAR